MLITTPLPNTCDCSGSNALAYYNSNTDCTLPPVWVEHKDIKGDLNFTNSAEKTENTPRGKNICFRTYSRNKSDLGISLDISCDFQYEGNALIADMAKCGSASPKDFLFLSKCLLDIGAAGFRGCFNVFDLNQNNPQSGDSVRNVTMAPASACTACACPVQQVVVAVSGEITTLVANQQAQAQALSPSILSVIASRVIGMEASLALTKSAMVNVGIDDLLKLMQAMGMTVEQIQGDFKQISDHHEMAILATGHKGQAFYEFNREGLMQMLSGMNAQTLLV